MEGAPWAMAARNNDKHWQVKRRVFMVSTAMLPRAADGGKFDETAGMDMPTRL